MSPYVEFLDLLTTPLGYIWMAVLFMFLWKRTAFSGILISTFSLGLLVHWFAIYELHDDLYLGRLGGCVGSLSVTIAALSLAILLGSAVVGWWIHKGYDRARFH